MLTPMILPMLLASQPMFEDLDALDVRLAEASSRTAIALDRRLRLVRCPENAEIGAERPGQLFVRCISKGWNIRVATRNANAGPNALVPPLVQRGENVKVAIRGSDYTLHYQATAIEAGRMGDSVRIRFAASGIVLSGTVSGQGRVDLVD